MGIWEIECPPGCKKGSTQVKTKRVCRACGEPYFAGEDDPNCCRTCSLLEGFSGSRTRDPNSNERPSAPRQTYRRFGSRHFGQTSGLGQALQKIRASDHGIESHELTSDTHAVEYLERLFEAAGRKCVERLLEKRGDNVRVIIQCTACDWASIEREAQR